MAYSVDQLNGNPKPSQRRGDRPLPAHWPRPAPEPEGDQSEIEDDKAALEVRGNQAAHEACRGKHVIEPPDGSRLSCGRLPNRRKLPATCPRMSPGSQQNSEPRMSTIIRIIVLKLPWGRTPPPVSLKHWLGRQHWSRVRVGLSSSSAELSALHPSVWRACVRQSQLAQRDQRRRGAHRRAPRVAPQLPDREGRRRTGGPLAALRTHSPSE